MSLDVSLRMDSDVLPHEPVAPVRENGRTVLYTQDEWEQTYPGRPFPEYTIELDGGGEVFTANITHNLNEMASHVKVAGHSLYEYLWRPEEIGVETAEQLIVPLSLGLMRLEGSRDWFEKYNPPNGWGDYDGLVRFTKEYLEACRQFPTATVRAYR